MTPTYRRTLDSNGGIQAGSYSNSFPSCSAQPDPYEEQYADEKKKMAEEAWSLDQLTLAAWTLRTDVAVARAEVGAARAKTGVESQRPNPTVQTTNEKVISGGAATRGCSAPRSR